RVGPKARQLAPRNIDSVSECRPVAAEAGLPAVSHWQIPPYFSAYSHQVSAHFFPHSRISVSDRYSRPGGLARVVRFPSSLSIGRSLHPVPAQEWRFACSPRRILRWFRPFAFPPSPAPHQQQRPRLSGGRPLHAIVAVLLCYCRGPTGALLMTPAPVRVDREPVALLSWISRSRFGLSQASNLIAAGEHSQVPFLFARSRDRSAIFQALPAIDRDCRAIFWLSP